MAKDQGESADKPLGPGYDYEGVVAEAVSYLQELGQRLLRAPVDAVLAQQLRFELSEAFQLIRTAQRFDRHGELGATDLASFRRDGHAAFARQGREVTVEAVDGYVQAAVRAGDVVQISACLQQFGQIAVLLVQIQERDAGGTGGPRQ